MDYNKIMDDLITAAQENNIEALEAERRKHSGTLKMQYFVNENVVYRITFEYETCNKLIRCEHVTNE